jgi:hypothetical protein
VTQELFEFYLLDRFLYKYSVSRYRDRFANRHASPPRRMCKRAWATVRVFSGSTAATTPLLGVKGEA